MDTTSDECMYCVYHVDLCTELLSTCEPPEFLKEHGRLIEALFLQPSSIGAASHPVVADCTCGVPWLHVLPVAQTWHSSMEDECHNLGAAISQSISGNRVSGVSISIHIQWVLACIIVYHKFDTSISHCR